MIIAGVYVRLSKCVHVTKGTVTRARSEAPWEKGNIITVYSAQSHHRRPPYHMQSDLSSKVFEMAHSLHLVMGLVDHTKQFLLLIRTVCLCFFHNVLTKLQEANGQQWDTKHLNGFVVYLACSRPICNRKNPDTKSARWHCSRPQTKPLPTSGLSPMTSVCIMVYVFTFSSAPYV